MNLAPAQADLKTESALFSEILQQALNKEQFTSCREVGQILGRKLENFEPLVDFAQVWDFQAYGLAPVRQLQAASEAQQQGLLQALARGRFLEAYGIENAGMSFAAKMSLLAESLEEQKLYSLFASEEAIHFDFIQAVLGPLPAPPQDPFIQFLRELIRSAERRPLLLIIQVVLEGWGLDHYAQMMKTCRVERLKAPLQRILMDEAGHHGSGLALFEEADLTPSEWAYTLEMMGVFLDMVRIGPVSLMQQFETSLEGLTAAQRETVLLEMGARADTQRKLNLLRGLLQKADAHRVLAALEAKQGFEPLF
ncbi:hypothetical protein COW36_23400 [bacterium (Candidatus Blackallbacteria) CG17_big_fil_post_rev_8_21_14_2_50_48_46]|uniref:Ferritin-like domain-containing protein n=1 Tax=bacterium (Candidatus Blackallbacteria) CG17_big_fil_post_rev_8_21_14_2_50_48_46 TaxID=2014261 RepID=A0A2M7FY03_9BACT|nr:MAG: hypothetical protein COW64_17615 [bacterium (Candidatus Blackallbacteria) CG18_big_fil_WC_8_21_14_2_50_49_26]PIW13989.1 MAG: hypothetical protein COW36_23400 [bacterium (Candidatus Blackallbacteria) CG17_big_fil_post_rev_8_21_14_2_50_48_46]PIW46840.1 MAG: hypothetical protein COW20_14580 [bacterium (Candidatus Blackallbacteria) CG13_big_fil_rev_8_21_14_2_50_49_14]